MDIKIIQGTEQAYPAADINIVIDVIRAFTVCHVAFMKEVREIFLVNTVEEAFAMKTENPTLLLAGEIEGLPITGFDLDNSPDTFSQANIENASVVLKTTNGVKATLLALDADTILVCGLSNARNTALHARRLACATRDCKVNIIASHPRDDDDMACAQYIQDVLSGANSISPSDICARIRASRAARKFFDPHEKAFNIRDMEYCAREVECDFVMQVDRSLRIPRLVSRPVLASSSRMRERGSATCHA